MRIALAVHAFPPHEHTGVEVHVAALARELARRGEEVHVFAPRRDPRTPEFALRREPRDGATIHWLTVHGGAGSAAEHLDRAGMQQAAAEFLDRVRPDVVHFHHALTLGISALEESTRRGIPTLYTAHDYSPICHRTVLARPDLERCLRVGDSRACARCDRAVSLLNGLSRFADWQAGVLPESLAAEEREALARVLAADPDPQDADPGLELRVGLDRRRLAAFRALDLVLAPTRFLRDRLIEGGLPAERVELSLYGIEVDLLARLAPSPWAGKGARQPLVFGFLGAASKHKGLHVLLEAFEAVKGRARLAIHADSSDRDHVQALKRRAQELGAQWHGAFLPRELPRVLSGIDVVVVPSLWWENAPFVIRESFAAHRPVIASATPALAESVRDGVDGLLAAPGDARALGALLERCLAEPELVARLARAVRPPRDLADLATELLERYRGLIARRAAAVSVAPGPGRGAPRAPVPDHVRPFAARVEALESLSLDELARRAGAGLPGLAADLGLESPPLGEADLTAAALDLLDDARREIRWRAGREQDLARHLESARGALALREAELSRAAQAQLAAQEALEREVAAHAEARAALAAAAQALEASVAEARRLAGALAAAQELDRRLGDELDALRAHSRNAERAAELALEQVRAEARRRAEAARLALEELTREHASLQAHARELEADARELEADAREAEALKAALARHGEWLEREAAAFAAHFGPGPERLRSEQDFLAAHQALQRFERELEWRRAEMRGAHSDGGRLWRALLARSSLGRRMGGWDGRP
ncbi:MAG: glycosyltransferase [Planctomycetes bacterium]|nr:glycosyltransferase [Planctomycetota bacterium]